MVTFCLNTFSINHLQNISSYEIIIGCSPTALIELQLQSNHVTKAPFYQFLDYLDLLNERMHAIHDIVNDNNNDTIAKRLLQHGSESQTLCSLMKVIKYIAIPFLKQ